MIRAGFSVGLAALLLAPAALMAGQQQEQHGRKWKPLPETSHVVVTVEKGFNGKPLMNAAVIFHAVRDGQNDGNLEVKTDPDGRAIIDVIEVGSHVTVQVIASGFATSSTEMEVDGPNKELLVKLQRPRAQISEYQNNDGKSAVSQPGIQERVIPKPGAAAATTSTSTTTSTTTTTTEGGPAK